MSGYKYTGGPFAESVRIKQNTAITGARDSRVLARYMGTSGRTPCFTITCKDSNEDEK